MKKRNLTLASILVLVVVLGGCGKQSDEHTIDLEKIEGYRADASNQTDEDSDIVDESDAGDETKTNSLAAYQEILKAAPAIEGEHDELMDASFGYDENQAKFGKHYDYFAIKDINQDGIPELIAQSTVNFRWTPISIFTLQDGKAVLVIDQSGDTEHGTIEQCCTASGEYNTYICENNHIHSKWSGDTPVGFMEEDTAYMLSDTTLTVVDCSTGENGNVVYFGDICKKNVSENVDSIN